MKLMRLILIVAIIIACTHTVAAQEGFPLSTVRQDFREASVVVRMNVTDTKPTGEDDGHYYFFIASGQVTSSFKGKFRRGEQLEFVVRAEFGYTHTSMRGDKIAFLTSFVNRRDGPFQELSSSNSVLPYSPSFLARVRRVWRETRSRRNRTRAGAKHAKVTKALMAAG